MTEERDAKEYAWKWVTATGLLCRSACDLNYVLLTPDDGACIITLYDGEDTSGKIIATVKTIAARSTEFSPSKPIYCRRGLYLSNIVDNVLGTLVQWRPRASKEG